ncbi:MAG: fumarylacetoacetate hydrolase family protein [Thermoanaerobaculia bacterium]|nr:fumarylacetoacetate hydrolase family protein [Thermoanaerobaculia bacterium]
MLVCRFGPEGFYAAGESFDSMRLLYSDPLAVLPSAWELGRAIDLSAESIRPPIEPGKLVGIGRNYAEHARELDNPVPAEPVIFLKSPGSVVGHGSPIVLPPESERVEHEGEVAVVLRRRLTRADADDARRAILGVTCANDVTARDLQKRDPTFCRAKSFDTFCPLGPAILVEPDLDQLAVTTRVGGVVRQSGHVSQMLWGIVDLVVYASRMMTLEPGDVLLTGTPAGVATLADGDVVEVEIPGVGVLRNPVEAWRR